MKLDNVNLGLTVVRVMHKKSSDKSDKESIKEVHRGVVVQNLGNFLRVFDNREPKDGGDYDPLFSELFPVESKCSYIEVLAELKPHQKVKIPVQFN